MKHDLVTELINSLTILPGVGKKSAQRMALYLLDKNKDGASILANNLINAIENVQRCTSCRMLTSNNLCKVCSDSTRDKSNICVVESPSDVLAIESTGGFKGRYFVLMGRISFIDGVGPKELAFESLLSRVEKDEVIEIIIATNFTAEGEATAQAIESLLLQKKSSKRKKVARLAKGVPFGGELEYTDLGTIAQAMRERKRGS